MAYLIGLLIIIHTSIGFASDPKSGSVPCLVKTEGILIPIQSLEALVHGEVGKIESLMREARVLDRHFLDKSKVSTVNGNEILGQQITSSFKVPQFANISNLEGWALHRQQAIDAVDPRFAFTDPAIQKTYGETLAGKVEEIVKAEIRSDSNQNEIIVKTLKHRKISYRVLILKSRVNVGDYSKEVPNYDKRGFVYTHVVLLKKPWISLKPFTVSSVEDVFKSIYGASSGTELYDLISKIGQATAVLPAKKVVDTLGRYLIR